MGSAEKSERERSRECVCGVCGERDKNRETPHPVRPKKRERERDAETAGPVVRTIFVVKHVV